MPKLPQAQERQAVSGADRQRAALISSLTRIISEWSAPDFLTAVVAREGVDLDPGAITMITILSDQGPQRPSVLARHMVTGASNISKIVARLTAAKLSQRIADPRDARAHLVALTTDGQRVADTFVRAGDGLVEELLHGWSSQERADLLASLEKLESATVKLAKSITAKVPTEGRDPSSTPQTLQGDPQ